MHGEGLHFGAFIFGHYQFAELSIFCRSIIAKGEARNRVNGTDHHVDELITACIAIKRHHRYRAYWHGASCQHAGYNEVK